MVFRRLSASTRARGRCPLALPRSIWKAKMGREAIAP